MGNAANDQGGPDSASAALSPRAPIVTEHRELVGPLTIELAHETPIFIGVSLIRIVQLPRMLPRRFAIGILVKNSQDSVVSFWRGLSLGLFCADCFLQLSTERIDQSGKLRSVKSQGR